MENCTGNTFRRVKARGVILRSQTMKISADVEQKEVKAIKQLLKDLGLELNPPPTAAIRTAFNNLRYDLRFMYNLRISVIESVLELQTFKDKFNTLFRQTLHIPESLLSYSKESPTRLNIIPYLMDHDASHSPNVNVNMGNWPGNIFPGGIPCGVSLRSQLVKMPAFREPEMAKVVKQLLMELGVELNPSPTEAIGTAFSALLSNLFMMFEFKHLINNSVFELKNMKDKYEPLMSGQTLHIPESLLSFSRESLTTLRRISELMDHDAYHSPNEQDPSQWPPPPESNRASACPQSREPDGTDGNLITPAAKATNKI